MNLPEGATARVYLVESVPNVSGRQVRTLTFPADGEMTLGSGGVNVALGGFTMTIPAANIRCIIARAVPDPSLRDVCEELRTPAASKSSNRTRRRKVRG